MNPWPFVIAAYAVVILACVGLALLSWRAMRQAEAAAEFAEGDQVKPKHQRLVLALLALGAIGVASVLALSGLRDTATFFCAPGDLGAKKPADCGRLGGMVEKGSLKRLPDGLSINFVVTDGKAEVPVSYKGVTPDLFREGSGVVAEGSFQPDGSFAANNILAKHDERYMPPQMAGKMHETDTLVR